MGFRNEMFGGVTLVREAMRSPNYVAGASGWTINRDGSVEFNNGTFRGSLVAGDISIGTSPNWFRVDSSGNLWLGGATQAAANFAIANTGVVSIRSPSSSPRLRFIDSNSAPSVWPSIYAEPFGANGRRLVQLTSGQNTALSRSASLVLYSADATPLISYAQLSAQQVDITASPSTNNITVASGGTAITGAVSISGLLSPNGGFDNTSQRGTMSRFWAWGGTTGSWDTANYVASSIDGSASSNTWRTNPLASQARVGVVIQDVYWRNSVDTGYIGHQAANFTVGSREATKHELLDVDDAAGVDVLEGLRKLRPIRYRQLGMDEARLAGPDEVLHHLHPERRALGPAGAIRDYWRQWESSITHYGFTVEDIAGVFPDATVLGDDGAPVGWSVNGLLALVVRAVQQLAARVDDLNTGAGVPTGAR